MFKKIFILLSVIIIIIIEYYAESQEYFPNIIAPLTQIHAVLLAIIGILVGFNHSNGNYTNKFNVCWSVIMIGLGIYSSVNLHECNIYPWPMLWIGTALINLNKSKEKESKPAIEKEIQFQNFNTINEDKSFNMEILETVQNSSRKKSSLKNMVFFVLYVLLLSLFTYNTHKIAQYKSDFPILGHTITMKAPGEHYKITLHYYCSDIYNSRYPTIILQHGGGGNLVGFLPLLKQLEIKGIKVCVYDRLGYGRSSKIIPHQNYKQKTQTIDLMFSLLLRPDERVIYGGWSAGVEASIAYYYYYPDRIDGLIFMDGYPDYLLLQAIYSNATQVKNAHALLISKIFRFIEPYGLDLLFGGNQIQNASYHHYYEAYYRTGYLWDTQQTELRFMNSTTEISEMGKQAGSALPYPEAKIYLNWPDVSVPLLVMPANNTVSGTGGGQYKIQSEKYLQKCTNKIKKMEIIEGNHDFVTISFEKVGTVIKKFIEEVIQLN